MEWTTETPTEDGFYWVKYQVQYTTDGPEECIEVVQIQTEKWHDGGSERWINHPGTEITSEMEELGSAQWYGPLLPPEI